MKGIFHKFIVILLCSITDVLSFVISNDDGTYVSSDDLALRIDTGSEIITTWDDAYYNNNNTGALQIFNVTSNDTLLQVDLINYENRSMAVRDLLHQAYTSTDLHWRGDGQIILMSALAYHLLINGVGEGTDDSR
jgi:hypothetical protein